MYEAPRRRNHDAQRRATKFSSPSFSVGRGIFVVSLKRFAFEREDRRVDLARIGNHLGDADFASLQFFNLSRHVLEERSDFVAGAFAQVDGQSFAGTVRQA